MRQSLDSHCSDTEEDEVMHCTQCPLVHTEDAMHGQMQERMREALKCIRINILNRTEIGAFFNAGCKSKSWYSALQYTEPGEPHICVLYDRHLQ